MPAVDFPNPRAAALSAYRNGTARGGVMAKPAMAGPTGGIDTANGNGTGGMSTAYGNGTAGQLSGVQTTGAPAPGAVATMPAGSPRDALAGFRARNPHAGANIGGMRSTMGAQKPKVPGIMRPNRMDYR